jgi:hypothetical protein
MVDSVKISDREELIYLLSEASELGMGCAAATCSQRSASNAPQTKA